MNVINSGTQYQIYSEDNVKTYDRLPIQSYDVSFSKFTGFYLSSRNNLDVKEDKIYGNSEEKVNKILKSFSMTNRNFGVILSGPKGVGKSLFARILAEKSTEAGYPIIIVSDYVPGIANFISSINQEVVVVFDEFEKTFADNDDIHPQEEMLSLFDGIDNGKKLFIVTCNELRKLNEFFINRPGRFHYHFSLENPNGTEIAEYMKDKLNPEHYHYIPQIINFSVGGNITYDCLRAISFELNNGYSLEETVKDLNIARDKYIYFDIIITFEDGLSFYSRHQQINFCLNQERIWFYEKPVDFSLDFSPSSFHLDEKESKFTLTPEDVKISYDFDDEDMTEDQIKAIKNRKVTSVIFQKCKDDFIYRYAV